MATINVARYYNIEYLHGNIATGRIANINFLTDEKIQHLFPFLQKENG